VVINKAKSKNAVPFVDEVVVEGGIHNPIVPGATRLKLKLKQEVAGKIFGGGKNALSRYETMQAEPPRSTVFMVGFLRLSIRDVERFLNMTEQQSLMTLMQANVLYNQRVFLNRQYR